MSKLKLKFPKETENKLTFGDVKVNQFFIDEDGALSQKVNDCSYTVIAYADGSPCADYYTEVQDYQEVKKILPIVDEIEFNID